MLWLKESYRQVYAWVKHIGRYEYRKENAADADFGVMLGEGHYTIDLNGFKIEYNYTGRNGECDHVGIVESVIDGKVNTIEGNSGDSCRRCSDDLGSVKIYGYGIPTYQ